MTIRTRFAPSPTGPLHLGHAYAAKVAFDLATRHGGAFLLRMEDIDRTRAKPVWEEAIYRDLSWLGLNWSMPVMRQSERGQAYRAALDVLNEHGLIYECHCNRRDILEAASAPQEGSGPLHGADGVVYPGTCRPARPKSITLHEGQTLRMNLGAIGASIDFKFVEEGFGPNGEMGIQEFSLNDASAKIGDFVVARRDMGSSYHLSVVVDDAAQSITHVTRGQDLFEATSIHVILQRMLGYTTPIYHHHRLIRDAQGKRLAKRDDARAIAHYRELGLSRHDVFRLLSENVQGAGEMR